MTKSVDPDQTALGSSLIWVYSVQSGMYVWIFEASMAKLVLFVHAV